MCCDHGFRVNNSNSSSSILFTWLNFDADHHHTTTTTILGGVFIIVDVSSSNNFKSLRGATSLEQQQQPKWNLRIGDQIIKCVSPWYAVDCDNISWKGFFSFSFSVSVCRWWRWLRDDFVRVSQQQQQQQDQKGDRIIIDWAVRCFLVRVEIYRLLLTKSIETLKWLPFWLLSSRLIFIRFRIGEFVSCTRLCVCCVSYSVGCWLSAPADLRLQSPNKRRRVQ